MRNLSHVIITRFMLFYLAVVYFVLVPLEVLLLVVDFLVVDFFVVAFAVAVFFVDAFLADVFLVAAAFLVAPPFLAGLSLSDSSIICMHSSSVNALRSEEHTSELQSRPHLVCR